MPHQHIYRVFDLRLAVNMELPGLIEPCADATAADITATVFAGKSFSESGFDQYHEWPDEIGTVVMAGARRDDEYLLRFPGQADFLIHASLDRIEVFPSTGCTSLGLAHLLLDQVLPRLLNQQGRLVIHASSVIFPTGETVAFLGNTGYGKSTLASSLYQSGCRLLSDDCLLVDINDRGISVLPAYAGLRLWHDSFKKLFAATGAQHGGGSGVSKVRMMVDKDSGESVSRQLSALFVLGEPGALTTSDAIVIDPLQGQKVVMALVESAFVLDLVSHDVLRQNFSAIGRVALSGLPFFKLNYPRDFALLPKVRAALEHALKNLATAPK